MKYRYWFALGVVLLNTACKNSEQQEKLTIATSANMQFAIEELTTSFTQQSGIQTEIILGSSGVLTAQIKAGAPYDIFVSADLQYPDYLFEEGLGYQKPDIYGYGQLVLWTCKEGMEASLSLLGEDSITHIALPNPELAPYGRAAREVLLENGLYEEVSPKLVYGESITQTNQFIRTGAAEIGFTALSVVLSKQMPGSCRWKLLPRSAYSPIAQGVLILNKDKELLKNAMEFHTFLKSEKGQKILKDYGYLTTDE